jgi:hypothetical protein
MILSARAGVPEQVIQMKLAVLERMKCCVKTAFGTSMECTYFDGR